MDMTINEYYKQLEVLKINVKSYLGGIEMAFHNSN